MNEEPELERTELQEELDGNENLMWLSLLALSSPFWFPVWLYVRLVHRRPSRCIRKRFEVDRPHDGLVDIQIERKAGQRVWGRLLLASGHNVAFEYHRELDVLTVYGT